MGLRCILRVLGASEEKLYALEGFVPPTHYAVWVGEPDYVLPYWMLRLERGGRDRSCERVIVRVRPLVVEW